MGGTIFSSPVISATRLAPRALTIAVVDLAREQPQRQADHARGDEPSMRSTARWVLPVLVGPSTATRREGSRDDNSLIGFKMADAGARRKRGGEGPRAAAIGAGFLPRMVSCQSFARRFPSAPARPRQGFDTRSRCGRSANGRQGAPRRCARQAGRKPKAGAGGD